MVEADVVTALVRLVVVVSFEVATFEVVVSFEVVSAFEVVAADVEDVEAVDLDVVGFFDSVETFEVVADFETSLTTGGRGGGDVVVVFVDRVLVVLLCLVGVTRTVLVTSAVISIISTVVGIVRVTVEALAVSVTVSITVTVSSPLPPPPPPPPPFPPPGCPSPGSRGTTEYLGFARASTAAGTRTTRAGGGSAATKERHVERARINETPPSILTRSLFSSQVSRGL